MLVAWRICKTRHVPYDGTGARLQGARWNSAGRSVIYAADSYAGAILAVLAHALRPRTLLGPHHGGRIEIPDALVETVDADALPGWDAKDSVEARTFGDAWLAEQRSAGRNVLINPEHPEAGRIVVSAPFAVPWDERMA